MSDERRILCKASMRRKQVYKH